jgi:hypothetical protein
MVSTRKNAAIEENITSVATRPATNDRLRNSDTGTNAEPDRSRPAW